MRTVVRLAGAVAVFVVVRNTVASVLSVVLLVMLVLVCLLRGLALKIWLRARVVCARLLMALASLLLIWWRWRQLQCIIVSFVNCVYVVGVGVVGVVSFYVVVVGVVVVVGFGSVSFLSKIAFCLRFN